MRTESKADGSRDERGWQQPWIAHPRSSATVRRQRRPDIPARVTNQLRRLVPNHDAVVLDCLRAIEAGPGGRVVDIVTEIASDRLFVARHRDGSLGLVRVGEIRGP